MNQITRLLLIPGLALGLSQAPSSAETLVNSDFDAGYSTGTINTQSGTNDFGLSGSWSTDATAANDIQIVSGGLDYQISGGAFLSGGSQALRYQQLSGEAGVNTLLTRNLSTAATSNEVYIRFVIQLDAASGADDYTFWWLSSAGDASNHLGDTLASGVLSNDVNAQVYGDGRTSSGIAPSASPQLVVARFTKDGVSGQYETVDLWINPEYGDSESPISTSGSATQSISSISGLGIQVTNMTGNSGYTFDSLAIGTTWDDVVSVPEPGAFALFLGMLAGVAAMRRPSR